MAAATLKSILPSAKSSTTTSFYDHSNDFWYKQRFSSSSSSFSSKPKQGKTLEFGDGGAFPEIHVLQYPLGMGRMAESSQKSGSRILPETGSFDLIVKQNDNASKIVYSHYTDLVPKILKEEEENNEMEADIEETTLKTKEALEKIVNVRLSAALQPQSQSSKFIKYKPSEQATEFNSGAKERIIRMTDLPVDPLDPPKFKHKKVPKPSGSPPVPVMHSPSRPLSVKDQQDWKIPPCISNWKNPKGYTIPLDKRLASDGRDLQQVQVCENFARFSEALNVAEHMAREDVEMRSKLQNEIILKEKERKEQELRALAQKARSERTVPLPGGNATVTDNEREERLHRDKIREERHMERVRERRLDANKDAPSGKKSKITRDRDRDMSEKVAIGMATTGAASGGEVLYDQRLFNQNKGMDSGFATDDQYNVYDKAFFSAQSTLSSLYKPSKDVDADTYGAADEQLEKVLNTNRFKPDKGFIGASERAGRPRDKPLDFEKKLVEAADPFSLDIFFTNLRKGANALDKVGSGGTMIA